MIRKHLAALILTAGLGLVGGCAGLSNGNGSGSSGGLFSHCHNRNGCAPAAPAVAGFPAPCCPTGCGCDAGCCDSDSFGVPEGAYGVPALPVSGLGAAPCPSCGVPPISPYGVAPPAAIPGLPPAGMPTTPPPLMPQLTEPPLGNGGSTKYSPGFKYSPMPQAMPVPYYPGLH